jgi:hypothetical protein
MFFCPNCDNSFDIIKQLTGAPSKYDMNSDDTTDTESSNYTNTESIDISDDNLEGGADIDKLITDIVNKVNITETDIKGINVDKLVKTGIYKKLNIKNKELVYNTIQDLLPNNLKDINKKKLELPPYKAYFICNKCGESQLINEGTLIFSKTASAVLSDVLPENYIDNINNPTLSRTRRYICPESKCESHKNNLKREAVFFRTKNSFQLRYICTSCETSWLN